MLIKHEHSRFIDEAVAFTEKQIRLKTGLKVTLVAQAFIDPTKLANELVNGICDALGINAKEVRNKYRRRPIPQIRQVISAILHQTHPNLSLKETAKLVGCSHHTTVIHHRKVARRMIETKDELFMPLYAKACEVVRGEKTENNF